MRNAREITQKLDEFFEADLDLMDPCNTAIIEALQWVLESEDQLEPERP